MLAFFHGYIEPLDGIAALKHGSQMLFNGTLFENVQETAATLHCCESALLATLVGAPETFQAAASAGTDGAALKELHAAAMEFDAACEQCIAPMQAQAASGEATFAAGADNAKISPMEIITVVMAIWELIKKWRS